MREKTIGVLTVMLLFFACSQDPATDADSASDTGNGGSDDSVETGSTDSVLPEDTATDSDTVPDTAGDTTPVVACAVRGDNRTTLVFENHCEDSLTFEGSNIDSGVLAPGGAECRHLGSATEEISSVRFWGYIGENPGGEHHTLAEMTLNTDFYDFDWYNISHVDAHNLPMAIIPLEISDCRSLVCEENLLSECPDEGKFYLNGTLVSCVSPDRDNPDSAVAVYFEAHCKDAYSWSGDDADSMAACAGEDYAIVFCP